MVTMALQKTSSRLLSLLSLLQAHRDWSGDDLADRLDITPRTVRRDIDRLRELGYPIRAFKGPSGGYRLDAGSQLPPLLFDDGQAVALALALQSAAGNGTIGEDAARALATVRQVMPPRLRRRIDMLQVTAVRTPGDSGASPVDTRVLVELGRVIRAREELRFDYGNDTTAGDDTAAGNDTTARADATARPDTAARADATVDVGPAVRTGRPRRTQPHHLVTWRGHWYLLAWDLDREDWRTFRVDRLRPRTPTGPRFTPRELPGGDVAEFVTGRFRGTDGSSAEWPCRGQVVLDLPAEDVAPYAQEGIVEELGPERCRLTLGSWSWTGLAATLGHFGTTIHVIGPPELTEAFAELAARYAAAAASTSALTQ
ncbi:WYL domain-containing protein [Streptomyces sp. JH34]|uniref:helix-turn-helix transcriptional regulator n=1 Tax=Streptomyces sp. JH34 TaxID=2793633 RepID=UPI0023F68D92|nr:WYL domain-containing protein [Streptomyces sp. JH34]MDF6020457.1 WYL domain-containing protein [Streptomyces sp. JH34]